MSWFFNAEQSADLLKRGFTRRDLGRLATVITAGAALPFYNERALAQLSMVRDMPADAVKINANENPMGPCPEAAEAIHNVVRKGGRYMYEETFTMQRHAGRRVRREARVCHSLCRFERSAASRRSFVLLQGARFREGRSRL